MFSQFLFQASSDREERSPISSLDDALTPPLPKASVSQSSSSWWHDEDDGRHTHHDDDGRHTHHETFTGFFTERDASTRVAAEIKLSIEQLESSLKEVKAFNSKWSKEELANDLSGFVMLEMNIEELLQKANMLRHWHLEKHKTRSRQDEKHLLLAEISILLITPYVHRLLTTEDRQHPGGLFDFTAGVDDKLSEARRKLRDLSFQKIDPVYSTRYDGVCLASLMRSVNRDLKYGLSGCFPFRRRKTVSFWHRGHARVLASKFFGAITCLEMILTLGAQDEDDLILESAVGHRSHLEVDGVVEKALLYDRASAERNLKFFTSMILMANAVVDAGYNHKFLLGRLMMYAFAGCRLMLPWNISEAELRGELCYAGTKEEVKNKLLFARFVWNLPETPLVKGFYRLGLPRIRIDHEFYIPPQNPRDVPLEGGSDPIPARVVCHRRLRSLPRTTSIKKALKYDWPSADTLSPIQPSTTPLMEPFLTPNIDSASELPFSDVLLVTFHGGGFIALSSFSHENYYRIWARDMPGVTIVSADYRLAPDYDFPYAFNDAYRAYKYAVETCESNLGFKPRKILVAGDSAGGNLTCAVTVRAIEEDYRVPDGILLIYPVVDMRRVFSPSLMWSVNDRIVPFVFLECCMSAYLGSPEKAKSRALDTRCSPALADDSILRKMPPTCIVVGDCDPLMDQSIRFAHHLARLNVDIQCKVFQAMPHGFCSFIWPIVGVPEVKTCVDECTRLLKKLAGNRDVPLF